MDRTGARKRIAAGEKAVAASRGRTNSGTNARTKRGQAKASPPAKPARNPRAKADPPTAPNPADSWTPAERAAFVRATLEAGDPVMAQAIADGARWSWVLGTDLAARVGLACLAAGEDPAEWCRRQLAEQVAVLERANARRKERQRCAHPEKDRRGLRCGACGARGLPAVT